jgi:hypothetical protein
MIEIPERMTLAIIIKPSIKSIKAFCKTRGGAIFWQQHQQKLVSLAITIHGRDNAW